MNKRLCLWLGIFVLALLVITGVLTAVAAANNVATSRAGDQNAGARTANLLKPPECTMTLTNIVWCTGTSLCSGTAGNDLILGTPGNDTGANGRIVGGNGDDCILGGAGDDDIRGQAGNDVCIGGPGNDTFNNTCETQIQ